MSDEPRTTNDEPRTLIADSADAGSDSRVFGVSMRGIITMTIVVAVVAMSLMALKVEEPLYSLSFMAMGFYFGQKNSGKMKGES